MNVALVFDGLTIGGIERVGAAYARLLRQLGHEVTVINLIPAHGEFAGQFPPECPIHPIPFLKNWAPERISHLVNDGFSHRLVYSAAYAVYTLRCRLLRILWRSRYAALREPFDIAVAFSGHFNDLTFVADDFVRARHKVCWLHGALYQYMVISPGYINLYRKIKNLVCLSEQGDDDCAAHLRAVPLNKKKIYNPCAITADAADPDKIEALKAAHGDFCLMVGRLTGDKDQDTVIRAMKVLREKYGLTKKLVLVGDGRRRQELEELSARLGMADNVVFEGARMDVQNYYLAAHIYVHAAPLEGLPTVFLEAMAYDLPIASTDAVPGAREILRDGECGLISPNADPEALANSIRRLYEDEALRDRLLRKARDRLQDFAPDTVTRQLSAYLTEITSDRG